MRLSLGMLTLILMAVVVTMTLGATALYLHRSNRVGAVVQVRALTAMAHRFAAAVGQQSTMQTSRPAELLAKSVPSAERISVMVWDREGKLLVVAGAPLATGHTRPTSTQGETLNAPARQLLSWQTDPMDGRRVLVVSDLSLELAEADRRTQVSVVILSCVLVGLGGGAALLLRPQFRTLRSLTNFARSALLQRDQPRARCPWWLTRELPVLREALRQSASLAHRRQAIEAESHAILQACIELAPVAQGVLDITGRLLFVNQSTLRLFNATRSELLHAGLRRLVAPEYRASLDQWVCQATTVAGTDAPGNQDLLIDLALRDGSRIPIRLSMSRVGEGEGSLLVFHCVDRRDELARTGELQRALDAARASSQAKTRFLATLSHEIRTPLNGLSGMMDLLGRTHLSKDQRELMDVASGSTRQLRMLLNDLLDLSKIEADKLVFESIPFDVQDQIGNAIRPFRGIAESRGLSLACEWSTPVRMLLGDPHRICQVLNNLLDNALKFTEQGGISVHIMTTASDDGDSCELRVDVADTGIGIPHDRAEAIFEAFSQVDESTSRKYGGTGLGLALSRKLCQHMGGTVRYRPNALGGSVFSFSVVGQVAHGMSPFVDTDTDVEEVGRSLRGRRVLIIDDNRVNQMLLTRWLQREGMTVDCAQDGLSGSHAVTEQSFDIVLMDVSMPVMNGLDATRAIRALAVPHVPGSERFLRLPIIGVSAHAMQGDQENCLSSGMNDYVTKPIVRDLLLAKIASAIDATGPGTRGDGSAGTRGPGQLPLPLADI